MVATRNALNGLLGYRLRATSASLLRSAYTHLLLLRRLEVRLTCTGSSLCAASEQTPRSCVSPSLQIFNVNTRTGRSRALAPAQTQTPEPKHKQAHTQTHTHKPAIDGAKIASSFTLTFYPAREPQTCDLNLAISSAHCPRSTCFFLLYWCSLQANPPGRPTRTTSAKMPGSILQIARATAPTSWCGASGRPTTPSSSSSRLGTPTAGQVLASLKTRASRTATPSSPGSRRTAGTS